MKFLFDSLDKIKSAGSSLYDKIMPEYDIKYVPVTDPDIVKEIEAAFLKADDVSDIPPSERLKTEPVKRLEEGFVREWNPETGRYNYFKEEPDKPKDLTGLLSDIPIPEGVYERMKGKQLGLPESTGGRGYREVPNPYEVSGSHKRLQAQYAQQTPPVRQGLLQSLV